MALLSTVDPGTGQPVVRAVFTASDLPGMGIGGPTGGDLYFDVAPGYYPSSQLDDRPIVEIPSPIGWGTHGFFPHRRTMHAILYLWGAGVETGKVIGPVQQVDVFPTVARLLAVPAPPTVIVTFWNAPCSNGCPPLALSTAAGSPRSTRHGRHLSSRHRSVDVVAKTRGFAEPETSAASELSH